MKIAPLVLPFVCAGAVMAQSVSLTLSSPVLAQVSSGGQTQTTTQAAGPVALNGLVSRSIGGTFIATTWESFVAQTGIYFYASSQAYVDGFGGSVQTTGVDFLFELSNPTPVAINLYMRRDVMAGVSLLVDVGNDGSVEMTQSSSSGDVTLALSIGPVPLPIRIVNNASQVGSGAHNSSLQISAVPAAVMPITQLVAGCDVGHQQLIQPRFDGGISLRVVGPICCTQPAVMVLGTSVQPLLLPALGSFPCLLVPSPDLVLFPGTQGVDLQVPAALRPVTILAQAVVLYPVQSSVSLRTTNALQVPLY